MIGFRDGAVAPALVGLLTAAAPASDPRALGGRETRERLTDDTISYTPPGSYDTGMYETFRRDGTWHDLHLSRGPIGAGGRRTVSDGKLCIRAGRGTHVAKWLTGWHCRNVWTDRGGSTLYIDHLSDRPGQPYNLGLPRVVVSVAR